MMVTIVTLCAAIILITAFYTDLVSLRIPNLLTIPALLIAFVVHAALSGGEGAYQALLGALAGGGPLLLVYVFGGIGAGDVKLFAALGAWMGTAWIIEAVMYAVLYAGAAGLVFLAVRGLMARRLIPGVIMLLVPSGLKDKFSRVKEMSRSGVKFPFMLAAVPGAVTAWLMVGL